MAVTNKQIEEAKAYLRSRINAEISMTDNLERYLREAASRMVDIAMRYNIPPSMFRFSANKAMEKEIDQVVRWLKSKIEEAAMRLAVAYEEEPDDYENIVAYITAENHGKTFRQRNAIYCERFKYEVEAAIAAGLLLSVKKDKIKQSIYNNMAHPYANPIFREAMKEKTAATRLQSRGISYGTGRSNSMRNALEALSGHAVSQGWMRHWGDIHDGAIGFYSYRGSSYPCGLCDSMVGYHPITDYQGGWHLHCRCFFVFT